MPARITTAPIACTLSPADHAERAHWIGALNRMSLRAHARVDRTLTLTYAPAASEDVRRLASQEAHCCAFLAFEVHETPDAVHLLVTAPAEAGPVLDPIFAELLLGIDGVDVGTTLEAGNGTRAPQCGPSCGCGTGSTPAALTGSPGRLLPQAWSRERLPGAAAATAGVAALACGVCCVLPLALPAALMATAGSALAVAANAYSWALGVSVGLTAAAWLWVVWESARARRRPATSTLRTMGVATLLVVLALNWPRLEPLARWALGVSTRQHPL